MRPGRGVEHPPPSSAEVKKKAVQLYFYSLFGLQGLILGEIYLLSFFLPLRLA
jgi:hypothetical protein